jgi:PAS domain S-box-containing protein
MDPRPDRSASTSRTTFKDILELAHIGSWEWDLVTGEIIWSAEMCRLFGEDPLTFKPNPAKFMGRMREPWLSLMQEEIRKALDGGGDYGFDHEIVLADGSVRHVAERGRVDFSADGKPLRMLGTTQDITERKRNEMALLQKQRELEVQAAFLESIVENIPTAIFIKDIRDGFRVRLWNKAAEDIFQVKKADIIGKNAHDLWPKDQADPFLEADRSAVAGNKAIEIVEEPSRTVDRGTIYLNTVKLPLVLSKGAEPEFLLAMSNDVTRYRQVNAELHAAKEAAESANRAKDGFLAMMSHEIRTPMNGVLGMAQLLENTPLSREQAGMVETMKLSGGILLSVIDDILDYSKIEAGKMELDLHEFDMETVILEIMGLMTGEARKKGLGLELAAGASAEWRVIGDARRLRQVLMNLIGNAIKFTDQGGISIKMSVEAGIVRTDILDTGVGIAESARGRIFNKFSQADASTTRKFGGTGLGLAISKRLMDLMGGGLDFESEPGRGSTFTLRLPRSPSRPADRPGEDAGSASFRPEVVAEPRLGLHVLLAEDNQINRKVGRKILEILGCTVDIAEDGVRAVELALRNPYDCILMDVHMPNMDGLAAARSIREWEQGEQSAGRTRPRRRIVALTASVMPEDRAAAVAAGMDGFLTKPILMDELARVLLNGQGDGAGAAL